MPVLPPMSSARATRRTRSGRHCPCAFPMASCWARPRPLTRSRGPSTRTGGASRSGTVSRATPGAIEGGATGDIAVDHYHRWRERHRADGRVGPPAYRFSIAWPRVIPTARARSTSRASISIRRLVDGLLERGIEPVPTLYHWDLPQPLKDGAAGQPGHGRTLRGIRLGRLRCASATASALDHPQRAVLLRVPRLPGSASMRRASATWVRRCCGASPAARSRAGRGDLPRPRSGDQIGITLDLQVSGPAVRLGRGRRRRGPADGHDQPLVPGPGDAGPVPGRRGRAAKRCLGAMGSCGGTTWRASPRRSTSSGSTTTSAAECTRRRRGSAGRPCRCPDTPQDHQMPWMSDATALEERLNGLRATTRPFPST